MGLCRYGAHNAAFLLARSPSWKSLRGRRHGDGVRHSESHRGLFFDESRRLTAGAVTGDRNAASRIRRRGCRTGRQPSDARPVSPADEIRRIAPLLDALSDQMHRVSIDSFNRKPSAMRSSAAWLPERYPGFPDPALYPDIAEGGLQAGGYALSAADGIATRTGHLRPEDALDEIVRFFEAQVSPCDGQGRCRPAHPRSGDGPAIGPWRNGRPCADRLRATGPRSHGPAPRASYRTARRHAQQGRPIFYRRNLLATLRERKLRAPVRRWPRAKALPFRAAKDGERVSAAFTGTVQLTSGKFAIVERATSSPLSRGGRSSTASSAARSRVSCRAVRCRAVRAAAGLGL